MASVFKPVSECFRYGRVPFKFEKDFDRSIENDVRFAMNFLQEHTPLFFDEVSSFINLNTYIHFQHTRNPDKDHCTSKPAPDLVSSFIGFAVSPALGLQWKSNIRIPESGDSCNVVTFVHEILHSLGFIHEHQRPDRDEYVVVDMKLSDRDIDYLKYPTAISLLTEYDYCSIMHYDVADVRARIWEFNGSIIDGKDSIRMKQGSWNVFALLSLPGSSQKGLLNLDSSNGDFQLARFSNIGEADLEVIESGSWSGGWSAAEFITVSGKCYLGLYKRITGDLHFNRIDITVSAGIEGSAFGVDGIDKKTLDTVIEKNYQHMIPFVVNDRSYLLFIGKFPFPLNADFLPLEPEYSIYEVSQEGKTNPEIQKGILDSRFTEASAFASPNGQFLLLYNGGDGHFSVHRIISSEDTDNNFPINIGPVVQRGKIRSGFSKIEITEMNSKKYLIGFNFGKLNSGFYIYEINELFTLSEVDNIGSESGYESFKAYADADKMTVIGFRPMNQEIKVKKNVPITEILKVEDGSWSKVDYAGQGLGLSKLDLEAINKLFG